MVFAINILSLILVLGMCWAAMMWYTRHSVIHADLFDPELQRDRVAAGAGSVTTGEPCPTCEGVGAKSVRGTISPCPACLGTGETPLS